MAAKIHDYGELPNGSHDYGFHCPGCRYDHPFNVPRWQWNGSFDKPTFTPSLLVNQHDLSQRCHSFVVDGMIQYLSDCWHPLADTTVELPDWDERENQ